MKVAPGNAGSGAALHRRGADLGVAQHVEGDGKAIHPLFEQRLDRLRRHVAAGKAGAAGGDDRIDASSAIHRLMMARIASTSSTMISRAARR
jgi:hypothetical protein